MLPSTMGNQNDWTNRRGVAIGAIMTSIALFAGIAFTSPSKIGYGVAGILFIIGVSLLVYDWIIRGRTSEEPNHPNLSWRIHEERGSLLLAITNNGAPATVWAKMTTAGDTLKQRTDADAVWNHKVAAESDLGRRETRNIKIAETRKAAETGADSLKYYWYVPFIENGQLEETRSLYSSLPTYPGYNPREDINALGVRQKITIEVFSNPTLLSHPIRRKILLIGCDQWDDISGS